MKNVSLTADIKSTALDTTWIALEDSESCTLNTPIWDTRKSLKVQKDKSSSHESTKENNRIMWSSYEAFENSQDPSIELPVIAE